MSEAAKQLAPSQDLKTLRISNANMFNPIDAPICSRTSRKLDSDSAWIGHLPFAKYLVSVVKPRVLVELGIHHGASYCAFCQAVKELRLSTRCFAIESSQSDAHAGVYSQNELNRLRDYHDQHYSLFSSFLQSTFDDALSRFENGSIDVLHIDGLYSYAAVKRDYDRWRSKMSERGLILFHDTEVRDQESIGLWRFWDEEKQSYPHFEFFHSNGLGVLAVGGIVPETLWPLFNQTAAEAERTRQFFANLGDRNSELHNAHLQNHKLTELLQVQTEESTRLVRQKNELGNEVGDLQAAQLRKHNLADALARQVEALQNRLQARRFRLADKLVRGSQKVPLAYAAARCLCMGLARIFSRGPRVIGRARRILREEGARSFLRKVVKKLKLARYGHGPFRRFALLPGSVGHLAANTSSTASFESLPWVYTGDPGTLASKKFQILVVSHEASRTGAPIILLALIKELVRRGDCTVRVVLDRSGEIAEKFAQVAPTLYIDDLHAWGLEQNQAPDLVASLFRRYAVRSLAICNTVAVGAYYEAFAKHRVPVFAWIHELPTSIDSYYGGQRVVEHIVRASRRIVTPTEFVRRSLIKRYGIDPRRVLAIPYGVAASPALVTRNEARARVRQELGLPSLARIVLGCGAITLRKGPDLFVQAAQQILASGMPDVWFVWIGPEADGTLAGWVSHDSAAAIAQDRVLFVGPRADVAEYILAADLFLLTSREDPFPLVNIQALASGVPVIAFTGAGGAVEILDGAGAAVPYLDVAAMARAASDLLANPTRLERAGQRALEIARDQLDWDHFAGAIVDVLRRDYGYSPPVNLSVSVIVPNYNHAPYLEERLRTVFAQTRRPLEIIVLDDASTDDSVTIVRRLMAESPVPIRLVVNDKNSGSTFRQWLKGFGLVSGDLVWIAESDDSCRPEFLESIVAEFFDADVVLAYSQSVIIDHKGQVLGDYLAYTYNLSPERWQSRYTATGAEEVERALLQQNTIPNASAVVFRRSAIPLDVFDDLLQFKLAGDWFFYAMVLRVGKIAFIPEALNRHRRHDNTVRHSFETTAKWYVPETLKVRARLAEMFPVSADAIARCIGVSAWENHIHGPTSVGNSPTFSAHPELAADLGRLRAAYDARAWRVGQDSRRILVIAHDLEVGGGELAAIHLANRLAKSHQVLLCNARPWRVVDQMLEQVDPSVRLLEGTLRPTDWSYGDVTNRSTDWPEQCQKHRVEVLRELIRVHKIDVIDSHVWWADKVAYEVNCELGLPWFMHMHGCYEALATNPEWDPEFATLVGPMMAAATGVFYGTDRNLRIFSTGLATMPRHLIRVFNGFDPAKISEKSDGSMTRSATEVIFVLVARPIPQKGWEEAIRATLWINTRADHERGNRTAKLILIGDGPHADELRVRYAEDRAIEFRGQIVPATAIVAQCDVGLLPSSLISESVPLAVIDYLACGVPVIATNIGAIPEMLRHKSLVAGTIVPLRPDGGLDVEPLASAMLAYVKDDGLLRRRRANARAVFDAQFHIDRIAAVCEEAYNAGLDDEKRPDHKSLPAQVGLNEPLAHCRLAS